jgi:hypothetical protein
LNVESFRSSRFIFRSCGLPGLDVLVRQTGHNTQVRSSGPQPYTLRSTNKTTQLEHTPQPSSRREGRVSQEILPPKQSNDKTEAPGLQRTNSGVSTPLLSKKQGTVAARTSTGTPPALLPFFWCSTFLSYFWNSPSLTSSDSFFSRSDLYFPPSSLLSSPSYFWTSTLLLPLLTLSSLPPTSEPCYDLYFPPSPLLSSSPSYFWTSTLLLPLLTLSSLPPTSELQRSGRPLTSFPLPILALTLFNSSPSPCLTLPYPPRPKKKSKRIRSSTTSITNPKSKNTLMQPGSGKKNI